MYSAQDARPPPGYGEEEEGEVQPRYSHQSQQYNHAAGQQQYKYVNDTNEFEHMGQFDHQPHQPHQQYQHHQHHNYAYVQQQQQQQHPHQQHQQYYHPQQQGQHYVADPYYHPHQQHHQQVQHHSPDDHPSLHHDQVHLQDQQHPQSDQFHPKEPLTIGGSPPPAGSRTIFHDKWFIFAFDALFVFMLVLSFIYGPQMTADISRSNPDGPNTDGENLTEPKDGMFIGIMVVAGVVGIAFSLFWLRVMQRNSTRIIQISLCACIALAVVGFIVALVSSNPWMAAWFIISGFCIGLYYYFVRSRIPFASAILESSVTAICENNGPILVVYGLSILNLAWLAFWAFVFASVLHAGDKVTTIQNPDGSITQYRASQTSGLQFLQFLCVVSLYWTCQTIKNIGHVTTAGTVASWWFQPSLRQPTRGAFIRACTTSLGSIIFGSLLVAIVQTIRAMLRSAQRDSCREIVDCLLSYMENALKWFNRYTFSTIAIYGLPFVEAAKRTGEMLSSQLFTAVINDDLSGMVLFCGNFLAASCSGVIALIWAFQADAPSYQVYGVLAFIVGYLVSSLAMSVIQSSVTTTFVCWACDPATLEHNRPNEFRRIVDAAHSKYGTIMQQHEQYQQEQHYAQQPQTYHLPQQ